MTTTARFATRLLAWTAALTAFLFLSGFGGADAPWRAASRLPGLAGFALVLACFPAGLSVGADVLRSRGAFVSRGAILTGAAFALMAVTWIVVQYVAPAALADGRLPGAPALELRELTLPALRDHLREVVEIAENGPDDDLQAWHAANVAAFEHERRLAHSTLPFFLTWLGALGGFWAARVSHRHFRLAQLLLMGLFLLVSIYLAGENGYELIAARMGGQAYFAAWFIPLAPAILGLGLGWPTMIEVFSGDDEDDDDG